MLEDDLEINFDGGLMDLLVQFIPSPVLIDLVHVGSFLMG